MDNLKFEAVGMLSTINAPYAKDSISTLGGKERASLFITISLDKPIEWVNGILENSRYARFSLDHDGKLELFSGGRNLAPFRKCTVKSHGQAIDKINKWVNMSLSILPCLNSKYSQCKTCINCLENASH